MNLIAAADENWGIGKNGGLLAHISGDMKYFRETTKGKIVVMGRKTLESFPGGKPLKNRVNIVLTGNKDFVPEGVVICHSVEETLEKLKEYPKEDVFIIGGGMIYKAFLPWCEKAYITHVYHTINPTKSELYGGQKQTFVAPYTKCDRIDDYRTAWAHFEKIFNK